MTATTHAILGGAIATFSPNLAVSLPLAVTSHFLVDLIPHWDLGTNFDKRPRAVSVVLAAIDVLIGAFIVYLAFGSTVPPVNLWLTVIASQLPDWIEAPYMFFNLKFAPSEIVDKIQHRLHNKLDYPWGVITQLFLILPLITSSGAPGVFAK